MSNLSPNISNDSIVLRDVQFLQGIIGSHPILQRKQPHIAFLGRSNVGKSTLINALTNNRHLVRTSGQPGKTKEINLFSATLQEVASKSQQSTQSSTPPQPAKLSNKISSANPTGVRKQRRIILADLPGYGYAQTSLKKREKLRKLILWYLTSGEAPLKIAVLIVDAKVGLKALDKEAIALLQQYGQLHHYQPIIVVNKIDKLNQKERHRQLRQIQNFSGQDFLVLPASAKRKRGLEKILTTINELLKNKE